MSWPSVISRRDAFDQGLTFYFTGKPCPKGHVDKRRVLNYACCTCEAKKANAYYHANAEVVSQKYKARYLANKESYNAARKQWKLNNAEHVATYMKNWRTSNQASVATSKKAWVNANRGKKNYLLSKRHAAKLDRTPTWLTEEHEWFMEEIYSLAALRTKMTGVDWHVDHIVPLQGITVSGLHVPWNLQVITATENMSKGNRYD